MKNLRYLRLSYNRFNALPPEMSELKNLTHIFLQGNRLSGDDSHIVVHNVQDEGYQFISDCGAPSDAAEPFVCANCDMCCNALGKCDLSVSLNIPRYERMKRSEGEDFSFPQSDLISINFLACFLP